MYIVIVGGGKLGAYLAGTLLREDNQVALIEKCDAQARRLAETIDGSCLVISGDGCSASVQEDAAMQSADVFVAATGQDEDNLAACEIASRVFDVPRCIARVNLSLIHISWYQRRCGKVPELGMPLSSCCISSESSSTQQK